MGTVSIERRAENILCKELSITRKQLKKRKILKNYNLISGKYILQQMNYKGTEDGED